MKASAFAAQCFGIRVAVEGGRRFALVLQQQPELPAPPPEPVPKPQKKKNSRAGGDE